MSCTPSLTLEAEHCYIAGDRAMKSPPPSSRASTTGAARRILAAASPWLSSTPAIDLAITALPLIADETTAEIVAELAMTIVDQREELTAVRATLAVALKQLSDQEAKKRRERQDKERAREALTNERSARI